MFLMNAIKPIVVKKFKTVFLFLTRLFKRVELRSYKIKQVLFVYTVGLLVATKKLYKRKEKRFY